MPSRSLPRITAAIPWAGRRARRCAAVRLIHRTLWNESHARFGRPEMVCTLAVALYDEGFLTCLGIGDSRIYLLRGGELQQLTTDDIDPEQPLRLTRALGAAENPAATTSKISLEAGDLLFLCSDGVHHHFPDEAIRQALLSGISARHLAKDARDNSPIETRDDCAAIRIEVDSLEWTARREDHQLPIPEKLTSGRSTMAGRCCDPSAAMTAAGGGHAKAAGK